MYLAKLVNGNSASYIRPSQYDASVFGFVRQNNQWAGHICSELLVIKLFMYFSCKVMKHESPLSGLL